MHKLTKNTTFVFIHKFILPKQPRFYPTIGLFAILPLVEFFPHYYHQWSVPLTTITSIVVPSLL